MKIKPTLLRPSLNKAYLKIKPLRTDIEGFKLNFKILLDRINQEESEENAKIHLRDLHYNRQLQTANNRVFIAVSPLRL